MAQEIGAINIAIGVDTSSLKAELDSVTAAVKEQERKFRNEKFVIPVTLKAPSETSIKTIQRQIRTQLNYAQGLGLELTPTIKVSNETGTKFLTSLQSKLNDKEVAVNVIANVEPVEFRNQIRKAVEPVDIGLTWHWIKPPPGGATGGGYGPGSGGGGGGGVRRGFRRGPRPAPPTGGAAASPYADMGPAEPEPAPPPTAPSAAPKTRAKTTTAKTTATPKGAKAPPPPAPPPAAAPKTAATSTPYADVGAAPAPAGAAGYGVVRGVPLPEAERPKHVPVTKPTADPTIERMAYRMRNRVEGGLQDLLALGGVVTGQGEGGSSLSFRRGSTIAKAPQEQQDAIVQLFQDYQARAGKEGDVDERGPRFGSAAPSNRNAAPIGLDPEQQEFNAFLRDLLKGTAPEQRGLAGRSPRATGGRAARIRSLAASKKAEAYRGSSDVKAFLAKIDAAGGGEQGAIATFFGPKTTLTPNLGTSAHGIPTLLPSGYAQGHAGDPAQSLYPSLRDALGYVEGGQGDIARAIARHHLSGLMASNPQLVGRLLGANAREINPKTGEETHPDPEAEALIAAVQSIFPEVGRAQAPAVEAAEKAYRKETRGTAGPPKPPASQVGTGGKRSFRGTAGEELDEAGRKALIAATKPKRTRTPKAAAPKSPFGPGLNILSFLPSEGVAPKSSVGQRVVEESEVAAAEAERAARAAAFRNLGRRAEGGAMRHNGILGRQGTSVTMVGERGPELMVEGKNGQAEIVPAHKIGSFLGRMGHRADGGDLKIIGTGRGQRYHAGGGFVTEAAARAGSVMRVFVVNWPSGGGLGAARGAPAQAATGAAFTAQQMNSLGQTIVAALSRAGAGGGGGGGAGGGGGTRPGRGRATTTTTPLTRVERAQLDIEQANLVTAGRERSRRLAAEASASQREMPTRGTPTSVGEIVSIGPGGLRGVIERRRLADEANTRSTAALGLYTKAQKGLNEAVIKERNETDPQKKAAITADIRERIPEVALLKDNYEQLAVKAEEMGKNVAGAGSKLRVFGANTAGVIAGTLLYSSALGAAQAGLQAIVEVAGPAIERLTGFQNVAAKVTGGLADQTRQSGGAVKATLAQTEATAGLSVATADYVNQQIESRVTTEAGNKALQEQFDLVHSAEAVRGQNRGLPGDKGLFSTTSGQFGTDIGGIPSTSEFLLKELADIPTAAQRAAPPAPTVRGQQAYGRFGTARVGGEEVANPAAADFAKNLEIGSERLDVFNNAAKKGGESVVQLTQATQAEADASADLARQGGPALSGIADLLSQRGLAFKGAQKPEDIVNYLQAANVGATRPSSELLLRQASERQIPNQVAAINAEEQQITIPTMQAGRQLDFLQNRPLPFGAGIVPLGQGVQGEPSLGPAGPGGIGKFPGVDPAAAQSFNEYKNVATSAMNAVIAKAGEGAAALQKLGVPPGLITEMTSLGKTAAGIELGIADREATLAASEYNHEVYTLNRSLADALALTGKRVGSEGRLGQLQRENFDLSKKQQAIQLQSQALSLALSQKQINFQRALAGFQAPGETAEERAARIKEAKQEADIAQRQLNFQKQLFGLGKRSFKIGVQVFDESARRQVEDLRFALKDLSARHQLELDSKAAQQSINAIHKRMDQISDDISNKISKQTKVSSAVISQALEIANASGEAFNTILDQTAVAWNKFLRQGSKAVSSIMPPGGQDDTMNGTSSGLHAGGYFGTVSGATSMIVGEAGAETVAILRNPRIHALQGPSGGGGRGGGGTIIIDVHDNHMAGEQDEQRLVHRISRAVEQSMNRKGALLNLRTV